MATRLPYYPSEDDIYSQLMAQYQNTVPYYSAAPLGAGMTGGYNPNLYTAAVPAPQVLGGTSSGSGLLYDSNAPSPSADNINSWSSLTPSQQAAFYASNPTFATATQLAQGLFGKTTLGMLQNAMVPNFVQQQQLIAKGIDPFGMAGLSAQEQANVNQALSSYLESSMNQPTEGAVMGYDPGAFGAYVENVAPTDTGVEVGGPIGPSFGDMIVTDLGLLDTGAVPSAAPASMGNDVVGFGSYGENVGPSADFGAAGETAPGGASFGSDIGFDSGASSGGDGGGGGGGGGKIICTKLHELGKMPKEIFMADQAFGAKLVKESPETYDGYVVWARHVVRWMSREDWIGKVVVAITHKIATPWSIAMAEEMGVNVKSNWFGRMLMKRGLQLCQMIGKMTQHGSLKNV